MRYPRYTEPTCCSAASRIVEPDKFELDPPVVCACACQCDQPVQQDGERCPECRAECNAEVSP